MLNVIIPAPCRLLGWTLLAAAPVGIGWVKDATYVQKYRTNRMQKIRSNPYRLQSSKSYIVREARDTIIKEVPTYVLITADAACVLSRDCARLHNTTVCPTPPEVLMHPPLALRSLPSPARWPTTMSDATKMPNR